MHRDSRILIIGHQDSLENSFWNYFSAQKFSQVYTNSRSRLDVLSQSKVEKFFKKIQPEYVFLGSVRSGGIAVNQKFPAEFIYENLQAQNNILQSAYKNGVKKLVYLGASCVYPKAAKQPIPEESLMTGVMEQTSEPYSLAKLAGIKLCQTYRAQYGFDAISIIPATLYGPGSDTNIETAHVMGALMAKFHQAVKDNNSEVTVWGTGKPRREFLYVDDFVAGVLFLMKKHHSGELINLGVGTDITIKELAVAVAKVSGFKGKIAFDTTKPDGSMRKLLDSSKVMKLGWKPKVNLETGIRLTYESYRKEVQ
ncbi:MAG: GDP-L-fucose synthase [Candidatus Omnitrophica bacterium]|nr:GDP-L-fucose synthase [Candidatus Omnitrophota bacterium]